jgi:hypothetical protein
MGEHFRSAASSIPAVSLVETNSRSVARTSQSIGVLGISRVSIQPSLGAEEIHRVFELRTILVGGLSRFVQVVNAHCELELKGFGFLFARDLKAFAQITFSFIQLLA